MVSPLFACAVAAGVYTWAFHATDSFEMPLCITGMYVYATGMSDVVPLRQIHVPIDLMLLSVSAWHVWLRDARFQRRVDRQTSRLRTALLGAQAACMWSGRMDASLDVRRELLPLLWCCTWFLDE